MTRRVTLTLLLALGALFSGCGEKGKPASESAAESSGLKVTAWNLQWFPRLSGFTRHQTGTTNTL